MPPTKPRPTSHTGGLQRSWSVMGAALLFISNFSFAQNPLEKQWDYRFGGTRSDNLSTFIQTDDGGYILAGYSFSGIGGDKTQPTWMQSSDYWIVKTDSLGNKQWDKDFGGKGVDALFSIQQTGDGGYILGGYSYSGMSGDKTQHVKGSCDYWIIKTDSLGNKQWDKDLGGTGQDELSSIQQTADGGYILGGSSWSENGGDKTEPVWGYAPDYWIVKTDSLGNKQWDKDFGGWDWDKLSYVQQTADGGYILGGYSESGIGGNKTQDSWGLYDYWIVKTDSVGNKLWDIDFGGTQDDNLISMQQTSDKGYILAGISYSGVSGDKTQNTKGYNDYWIVKTDSLGNKQWDRDFGGTSFEDEFGNISQTTDGGYLFAGTSYSTISGDKTENNLGTEQTWIVKTDSLGVKQWDKTLLTDAHDEIGFAIQTKEGCYVMANCTFGGIGGDKTQPNWDPDTVFFSYDYWFIKFCDTTVLISFSTSITTLCEKFCINFHDQSINNPTSWQWLFPGGTPSFSTDQNPTDICYTTPGIYDVTLITTNPSGTDTLTLNNYITVYPTPPFPTITQNGYMLTSSVAGSYQWQYNSIDIPGATSQSYTILQSGFYTVIVGDSNSCKNSLTVYVLISGVNDIMSDADISISPNPSNGNFTIEFSGQTDDVLIEVVNTIGQIIFSSAESRSTGTSLFKKEIDLRSVDAGVYIVEIKTKDVSVRKKIVITE